MLLGIETFLPSLYWYICALDSPTMTCFEFQSGLEDDWGWIMTLDSINAVAYTFLYIVPGFITSEVISALMPTKKYSEGEKAIQAIGYSVLNLAVWRWLFLLLQQYFGEPTPFFWLINTALIFATGGITGAVIGVLRAKNTVRRLFEHFNINYSHPIPTAWDYKFSDGKSYWVEVFLSNDKVIRGLYSGRSFASSDDEHRDIFIEYLYEKRDDAWVRVERTAGVLISPDEVRYIKFFELEGNNDEQ